MSRATWMHSWRQSPGFGQRDVADVELEVEVGVLDPVRVVEVERDAHQPLAEHPRLVEAFVDVVEDPLERHPAAWARSMGRRSRCRHLPCAPSGVSA